MHRLPLLTSRTTNWPVAKKDHQKVASQAKCFLHPAKAQIPRGRTLRKGSSYHNALTQCRFGVLNPGFPLSVLPENSVYPETALWDPEL